MRSRVAPSYAESSSTGTAALAVPLAARSTGDAVERCDTPMTYERIRLGISACLLGKPVRFDGGHKRDSFLVESLGQFVDWVPVCPEVESGLDAPRESMRLVQADGRIRLLTNRTAHDHTTRMQGYARRRVEE